MATKTQRPSNRRVRRQNLAFDIFATHYEDPFPIVKLSTTSSSLKKQLRLPWSAWAALLLPHILTDIPLATRDRRDVIFWSTLYSQWAQVGKLFTTHRHFTNLNLQNDQRMLDILQSRYFNKIKITTIESELTEIVRSITEINTICDYITTTKMDMNTIPVLLKQANPLHKLDEKAKAKAFNKLFKTSNKIITKIRCSVCSKICFKDVQFASPCQHIYCQNCFHETIRISIRNNCTICKRSVDNLGATESSTDVLKIWKSFVRPILRFSNVGPKRMTKEITEENGEETTTKNKGETKTAAASAPSPSSSWDARAGLHNVDVAFINETCRLQINALKEIETLSNHMHEKLRTSTHMKQNLKLYEAMQQSQQLEKECDKRIAKLFRKLSIKHHPDRNNGIQSPFWQTLTKAKDILGTQHSREIYERASSDDTYWAENKKQQDIEKEKERQKNNNHPNHRHRHNKGQRMLTGGIPGQGKACSIVLRPRTLKSHSNECTFGWVADLYTSKLPSSDVQLIIEMKMEDIIDVDEILTNNCFLPLNQINMQKLPSTNPIRDWVEIVPPSVNLFLGGRYSFRTFYVNSFGRGTSSVEVSILVEPPLTRNERNKWLTRVQKKQILNERKLTQKNVIKEHSKKLKRLKKSSKRCRLQLVQALREVSNAKTYKTRINKENNGDEGVRNRFIYWIYSVSNLCKEYKESLLAIQMSENKKETHDTKNTSTTSNMDIVDTNDLLEHALDIVDEFQEVEYTEGIEKNVLHAIVKNQEKLYKARVINNKRKTNSVTRHQVTASDMYEEWVGCRDGIDDCVHIGIPIQDVLEELATCSCEEEEKENENENENNSKSNNHLQQLGESYAIWTDDVLNDGGDVYGMYIPSESKGSSQVVKFDLELCPSDSLLWKQLANKVNKVTATTMKTAFIESNKSTMTHKPCPMCTYIDSVPPSAYECVQDIAMQLISKSMAKSTLKNLNKNPLCYFDDIDQAVIETVPKKETTVWNITEEEEEEEKLLQVRKAKKIQLQKEMKLTAYDLFVKTQSLKESKSEKQLKEIWKRTSSQTKKKWKEKAREEVYDDNDDGSEGKRKKKKKKKKQGKKDNKERKTQVDVEDDYI